MADLSGKTFLVVGLLIGVSSLFFPHLHVFVLVGIIMALVGLIKMRGEKKEQRMHQMQHRHQTHHPQQAHQQHAPHHPQQMQRHPTQSQQPHMQQQHPQQYQRHHHQINEHPAFDPTAAHTAQRCPACGNGVHPHAKFCSMCGNQLR